MLTTRVEIKIQDVDNIQPLITGFLEKIASDTEVYATMKAPIDLGNMAVGIHYSQLSPVVFVITSEVDYDVYYNLASGMGVPYHFVPFFDSSGTPTPLAGWAKRKLGYSDEDLVKGIGLFVHTTYKNMYKGGLEYAQHEMGEPDYINYIIDNAKDHGFKG